MLKFESEKLKKAVVVSEEKSRSVPFPKAGPIVQHPFCLPESAQTWAGIAFCAARKSGKNFQAASKFAG